MTPTYTIYHGERVQVLERFTAREECHFCGNAALDGGGECPACAGTTHEGYESVPVEWAKIGYLEGLSAGVTATVRAGALRQTADPARAVATTERSQ